MVGDRCSLSACRPAGRGSAAEADETSVIDGIRWRMRLVFRGGLVASIPLTASCSTTTPTGSALVLAEMSSVLVNNVLIWNGRDVRQDSLCGTVSRSSRTSGQHVGQDAALAKPWSPH